MREAEACQTHAETHAARGMTHVSLRLRKESGRHAVTIAAFSSAEPAGGALAGAPGAARSAVGRNKPPGALPGNAGTAPGMGMFPIMAGGNVTPAGMAPMGIAANGFAAIPAAGCAAAAAAVICDRNWWYVAIQFAGGGKLPI